MIALGALVLTAAVTSSTPLPHSGWHICNHYVSAMHVVVAETKDKIGHSWGWFTAQPGQCITPISDALDTSGNTHYFFYAKTDDGTEYTGGSSGAFLCLKLTPQFDISFPLGHGVGCKDESRLFTGESIDHIEFTTDLKP